jgi:hypothetical protein
MKTMQNPAGFRTVFTGSTGINLKQQNRTDHLLQKPDIFICYRHSFSFESFSFEDSKTALPARQSGIGRVSGLKSRAFSTAVTPIHTFTGTTNDYGAQFIKP